MQSLRQDVRYGLRLIKQHPGFALVTVLTLAFGIGANTAIFSILDALLLRSLPLWRPDRLVEVAAIYRNGAKVPFSYPCFQELKDNQKVFSALFGWTGTTDHNVEIDGVLSRDSVRRVTGNYYSGLGATPVLGRLIAPEDVDTPGGEAAVVGYEFWSQRFGRDPGIIGRVIRIEGSPFTIIGVSRKWFMGMTPGNPADITVPLTAKPFPDLTTERSLLWIFVTGRLRDGITIGQAREQLRSFWHAALVATAPTTAPGQRLESWLGMGLETTPAATGINRDLREHFERPLHVLMGLSGLILLVACVNLANLTLARVVARAREMSVRVALGATRLEIARQLLTETLLLSVAGGLLAFAFAIWGSHLLMATIAGGWRPPVVLDLRPDWRTFSFTALAAIGTAVLIACVPAWYMTYRHPGDALRADERTLTGGAGVLSKCLIVTQIALSLVLVFGAGLLLQTLANLRTLDPKFERASVVELDLNPRPERIKNVDRNSYRKQMTDAVANLPGVISASFASIDIPVGDSGWKDTVSASAVDSPADAARLATFVAVSPGFFRTLGIPILYGRDFDWTDDEKHPHVAIVDSNLARRLFPSGDALGRRVRFGIRPELQDLQIIGIARSARLVDFRDPDGLAFYVPSPQDPDRSGNLFVRSDQPAAIMKSVQSEIQSQGQEYSTSARTLVQTSDEALVEDRATALLSTSFAGLALLLAGIGLFGLMSYGVTRRTREIGIRVALGAQPGLIVKLIVREGVLLSILGIMIGIPCTIAATRLLAHVLFGVSPADPLTFAVSAALLSTVGVIAAYWPARRATRIDPVAALRCE
jgi:predicted permease